MNQLLAFLRVFNFYWRFVPAAKILRPHTYSTQGSLKATSVVKWTPPVGTAFNAARSALGAATLLAHPQQDQESALMADASDVHVGSALHQWSSPSAGWQTLAFFLKKLEMAQISNSAFDMELFPCVSCICHFRYKLKGCPFTIYIDHKLLPCALSHAAKTALLHGRVYGGYRAHPRYRELCYRCLVPTASVCLYGGRHSQFNLPAAAPHGHAGAGEADHPCARSQRCLQGHPQA